MADPELVDAIRVAKLKIKAGKGLLRDLTASLGHLEDLLQSVPDAEPKEAERHDHQDAERYCAVA